MINSHEHCCGRVLGGDWPPRKSQSRVPVIAGGGGTTHTLGHASDRDEPEAHIQRRNLLDDNRIDEFMNIHPSFRSEALSLRPPRTQSAKLVKLFGHTLPLSTTAAATAPLLHFFTSFLLFVAHSVGGSAKETQCTSFAWLLEP